MNLEGKHEAHLAGVQRNKTHRNVHWLASDRRISLLEGLAGYLHSFLWVIRLDT